MQHSEDHLGCRYALFLVDIDRNTTTIVENGNRAVTVQGHHHPIAMSGQGFVDGVIDHLEHHVMQSSAVMNIADVHAGSLADGFQTAQYGDAAGIVLIAGTGGGGFVAHRRSVAGAGAQVARGQDGNYNRRARPPIRVPWPVRRHLCGVQTRSWSEEQSDARTDRAVFHVEHMNRVG